MHLLPPLESSSSESKLLVDKVVAQWLGLIVTTLARAESAGRKPRRLTEPGHTTWHQFRGRLEYADFLALLFEDAAVIHPIPFDPVATGVPVSWSSVPEGFAAAWVEFISNVVIETDGSDRFIVIAVRALGLPTGLAGSRLPTVLPHHRVLELPGTGGQLTHHLMLHSPTLSLRDNFAVACGTWEETLLAGIVATELNATSSDWIVKATSQDLLDPNHPLRTTRFDFVIGLHPDNGGALADPDPLASFYPDARIVLV
ncbi:MAG: hypothetical protein HUU55_12990 [Myxococcales bacterium]|nr:hypothetical protein [Myxococcales bacterium]